MGLKRTVVIIDDKLWNTYNDLEKKLNESFPKNWNAIVRDDFFKYEQEIPSDALLVFLHHSQFEKKWDFFQSKFCSGQILGTGAGGTDEVLRALACAEDYLDLNWCDSLIEWDTELNKWKNGAPAPPFPISTLSKQQKDLPDFVYHFSCIDILVPGYLTVIFLLCGKLIIQRIEESFEPLKSIEGLRSREDLEEEVLKKKLAPRRLFRPLCIQNGKVCDNAFDQITPKPFSNVDECEFWFDSVLYEAYSDCPESLSGRQSVFTDDTDRKLKEVSDYLDPKDDRDTLLRILKSDKSLEAAVRLSKLLSNGDPNSIPDDCTGGAIRVIWELVRSGLNKAVANHPQPNDSEKIVDRLAHIFQDEKSGHAESDEIIEYLFSLAYLEYRDVYELLGKASLQKRKLKKFEEKRTNLNHNELKNNFLSKMGPFPGQGSRRLRMKNLVDELVKLAEEAGKHREAINDWKKHIKDNLRAFFGENGPDPSVIPNAYFTALSKRCKDYIDVLDDFVSKDWPTFFELEQDMKKKVLNDFWDAAINLNEAIEDLKIDRKFHEYFSVREQSQSNAYT